MKLTNNAKKILNFRYLSGNETPEDMLRRVAKAVAEPEGNQKGKYEKIFYYLMDNLIFLPNTPTLVNAGRPLGQLAACFVLPIEDSIPQIFETIKQTAIIHKTGGGTGFSFSNLRPEGWPVTNTKGTASGPVSFMKIFNAATNEMKQGGVRRGANMGILRVDHPDILKFITCKNEEGSYENFNISVAITDEFIDCLLSGKKFMLRFPYDNVTDQNVKFVDPNEIWDKIVKGIWKNGEPGVFFIDKVNRLDPLHDIIEATNPCAEQPLPSYGCCNLGSINVSKFVEISNGKAVFNYNRLKKITRLCVRFLDNVINASKYPLPQTEKEAKRTRRIGLGIMGLADAFVRVGIKYGSKESFEMGSKIVKTIQEESYRYSKELGQEKGIPEGLKKLNINRRNGALTTIAPTGSLSLIAGCSSGCEPIFSLSYSKRCIDSVIDIEHPLVTEYRQRNGLDEISKLPDYFITAEEVPVEDHVKMQSCLQEYIDSGVSKTINAPNSITEEEIGKALLLAYNSNCKSITLYREGSRKIEGQMKSVTKTNKLVGTYNTNAEKTEKKRPNKINGSTTKITTGRGKLYVTVNKLNGQPFEVFLQIGKSGKEDNAYSEAIGRLISLCLRFGVNPKFIVKHLKGITGSDPVFFNGSIIKSIPDAVAHILEKEIGKKIEINTTKNVSCPVCGDSDNIRVDGNCLLCTACGWNKCG